MERVLRESWGESTHPGGVKEDFRSGVLSYQQPQQRRKDTLGRGRAHAREEAVQMSLVYLRKNSAWLDPKFSAKVGVSGGSREKTQP